MLFQNDHCYKCIVYILHFSSYLTRGWSDGHTYSWTVRHQPSLNSLSVSVMEDDQPLWSHQWDKNFAQPQHVGQVGVYTHSQPARFFNMTVQPLCID